MTDQTSTNGRTAAAIQGRRADTTRRRERVLAALFQAQSSGLEISVGAIARAASVDRTFLYRHRDLLAQVHATQEQLCMPREAQRSPARPYTPTYWQPTNAPHAPGQSHSAPRDTPIRSTR